MGFHSKSSAEEVDAAREAGRSKFETSENPYSPKWTVDKPDPQKLRDIFASLGARDGRPPDPAKVKQFIKDLHVDDPLRAQCEQYMASVGWDAADNGDVDSGGPPIGSSANDLRRAHADKNAGEAEGGADGKVWRWEQTSKDGESEILVRFDLPTPATKKDVKVVFKAQSLKVTVAGDVLFDGKTYGNTYPDESTWSLVEKTDSGAFSELQVLISLAEDVKWHDLCAKE